MRFPGRQSGLCDHENGRQRTWRAEAGCEVYEIAAITGHSLKHTVAILEVYLPRNATMARNAIAKLSEHRKRTKLEG